MFKPNAILLIGPTGSGKTPLGNLMGKQGFKKQNCVHFDFGEQLRTVADHKPSYLNKPEYNIINGVLKANALLEDDQFPIAEKILKDFIDKHSKDSDLIILNGLPRHVSQADDMERTVHIECLVHLFVSPEVVQERIRINTGRDRNMRTDDTLNEINQKLIIFQKRTLPLLAYYRERRIPVLSSPVSLDTSAEAMLSILEKRSGDEGY
jgi:adenylate kinase family enzyme